MGPREKESEGWDAWLRTPVGTGEALLAVVPTAAVVPRAAPLAFFEV